MATYSKLCNYCGLKYEAVKRKGIWKRQKYCSKRCREKAFHKANPNKDKEYCRRWRLKQIVLCKYCGKPIPNEYRKGGRTICSEKCLRKRQSESSKKFNAKVHKKFHKYKEGLGCAICGYNKFGGSIDFHHKRGKSKERRITGKMWFSNSNKIKNEINKCVLLCKNCHYELHFKQRNIKIEENGDIF